MRPVVLTVLVVVATLALAGCEHEPELATAYGTCVAPAGLDPRYSTFDVAEDDRTLTIQGGTTENTMVALECVLNRLHAPSDEILQALRDQEASGSLTADGYDYRWSWPGGEGFTLVVAARRQTAESPLGAAGLVRQAPG